MGSQLNPLPLSRVGSRERPSESLFPQLHFGEPSSGFTPGLESASSDEKREGKRKVGGGGLERYIKYSYNKGV